MTTYDTGPLAHWVATGHRPTAAETRELRRCLLDTLACLAAGWNSDVSRKAARALRGKQRGMIARAVRYGTAMHALDFDDSEIPGSTHPSAVLLASLLPLSEQIDASVDAMLEAYLCGFETIVWFGRNFGYRHYEAGWHATATTGLFGAVAACAKLLDRNVDQIQNGLSLASSYAGGLKRQVGSEGKSLHVGMAAANALMIVPLISAGYQAGRDVWNGPEGYMALHQAERADSAEANAMLGRTSAFAAEGVVRKAWPSCHYTHRLISAALSLSAELNVSDIVSINLEMPAGYASLVSSMSAPKDQHQARFNASFCVASSLLDGHLNINSFGKRAIGRVGVRKLMSCTTTIPYAVEHLCDLSPDAPDRITIRLRDGATLSREISAVPGSREQPLDDDVLQRKARDCFGAMMSAADGNRLVKLALGEATSVRELTDALDSGRRRASSGAASS